MYGASSTKRLAARLQTDVVIEPHSDEPSLFH